VTQIGLEPRPMGTLVDRLAAFLEESADEVAALESRREELESERAERIVALREEYAEKIKAVDEELATVRKLKHALEGPKPRAKPTEPKRPAPGSGPSRFRPTEGKMRELLEVIRDGADIVGLMEDRVSFSRGTVENGISHLREDGLIRLTGERKASPDPNVHTRARTYAITPEGEAWLSANVNGNVPHS
jgi:hypothetical protein